MRIGYFFINFNMHPYNTAYFRYYAILLRRNYVTPTSYLELIKTFKSLLGQKRFQILTLKTRYLKGLEKLDFASSQVSGEVCILYFFMVMLPGVFHHCQDYFHWQNKLVQLTNLWIKSEGLR